MSLPSPEKLRQITDVEAISLAEAWAKKHGVAYIETRPAIRNNLKTLKSFECTTICPKHIRGIACQYCYVRASQELVKETERKPRAVKACAYTIYKKEGEKEGPVAKWARNNPEVIKKLNRMGGLRLFSDADFVNTPKCRQNLKELISESKENGLALKAITKQTQFVKEYHDDMKVINVSIDTIGDGMPWKEARTLREEYPNVKVRATAMNKEEVGEFCALPWVDIVTPYHGRSGVTYHPRTDSPARERELESRRRAGEPIKDAVTTQNMKAHSPNFIEFLKGIKCVDRTCCVGGKCESCALVCGARKCHTRTVERDGDTPIPSYNLELAVPTASFTPSTSASELKGAMRSVAKCRL